MAVLFRESDGNLDDLKGKTVAIIGFGNQGHAHALNLRDSGVHVIVGQRKDTAGHKRAISHGFQPKSIEEATERGDIVMILLPDEVQPAVYKTDIEPRLTQGKTLAFCHGFNIRYGTITPPADIDVIMVAPMGPGHGLRSEYEAGRGLVGLIAIHQDVTGRAMKTALAYCKGIGCLRAAAVLTTFAEETETDLFGEQVVLCGGTSALIKAAFDTLVNAGYQPEIAYFAVLHELLGTVRLLVQGGLTYKNQAISNTAEYGDLTRGPRIITEQTRREMETILHEIQNGEFASEWLEENSRNREKFRMLEQRDASLLIELIGREMRALMPWLEPK